MTNSIIVTLKVNQYAEDFELPGNEKLQELYPKLFDLLQMTRPDIFKQYRGVVLEVNGCGLVDLSATLFDYGICSGMYMDIVNSEKYEGFGQH